jgi:SAM-dependent methyltransferase
VATRLLLEVGAGFGTFGEELLRMRLFERYIAVEPSPDLAATCRRRGLETIDRPIEEADLAGLPVDVVASFEVIEHLFAPRGFLKACYAAMPIGGLLVLSCPNGLGFDIATLGRESETVDMGHINYFNPESLTCLVSSCGFEVLDVKTPGELDGELVRKKALAGVVDLSAQPFLRRVLLDEWERLGTGFQRFLQENRLSSHMWLVARRQGTGGG